jgi:hypothetical protein
MSRLLCSIASGRCWRSCTPTRSPGPARGVVDVQWQRLRPHWRRRRRLIPISRETWMRYWPASKVRQVTRGNDRRHHCLHRPRAEKWAAQGGQLRELDRGTVGAASRGGRRSRDRRDYSQRAPLWRISGKRRVPCAPRGLRGDDSRDHAHTRLRPACRSRPRATLGRSRGGRRRHRRSRPTCGGDGNQHRLARSNGERASLRTDPRS